MKRVGTLDVHEDWAFQKKEWLFERAGWVFLLLIVSLAVLGFSGSGPLAHQTIQSSDGAVELTYARFLRWQTSEFLEIQFTQADQEREIAIPHVLLERWNIQNITPEPEEGVPGDSATVYRFHETGPGKVKIEYQASEVGQFRGTIGFAGGRTLAIKQLALP